MMCPSCCGETIVLDSRPTKDDKGVRRRRICHYCGVRFTTHETVTFIGPAKRGRQPKEKT